MNITFLIGNGFDLCVGLKTKYEHFLAYYLKLDNDNDQDIAWFKELIESEIQQNNNWSDVELAMGEISKKFSDKERYKKCYVHLADNMAEYLLNEQKKIDYDANKEEMIKCFRQSVSEYYNDLSPKEKNTITNMGRSEDKDFNFISFNYTNVFDNCIEIIKKLPEPLAKNGNLKSFAGTIIHIHGTTDE